MLQSQSFNHWLPVQQVHEPQDNSPQGEQENRRHLGLRQEGLVGKELMGTSLVRKKFQILTVVVVPWVLPCAGVRQNVHVKWLRKLYPNRADLKKDVNTISLSSNSPPLQQHHQPSHTFAVCAMVLEAVWTTPTAASLSAVACFAAMSCTEQNKNSENYTRSLIHSARQATSVYCVCELRALGEQRLEYR